jgi:hypothetical protein
MVCAKFNSQAGGLGLTDGSAHRSAKTLEKCVLANPKFDDMT